MYLILHLISKMQSYNDEVAKTRCIKKTSIRCVIPFSIYGLNTILYYHWLFLAYGRSFIVKLVGGEIWIRFVHSKSIVELLIVIIVNFTKINVTNNHPSHTIKNTSESIYLRNVTMFMYISRCRQQLFIIFSEIGSSWLNNTKFSHIHDDRKVAQRINSKLSFSEVHWHTYTYF